jgi:MFS family permease
MASALPTSLPSSASTAQVLRNEHERRAVLRRPRLAVIGLFFLAGLTLAMWVVNIPAVQQNLSISHGALGGLLLLLGAGSVVGMQIVGPYIDRVGSRRVAAVSGVVLTVGVALPGLAATPRQLGVALFVLGLGCGVMDVAMNEQAVVVERRWGKPIMSSFHAFFSVGGAVGAGLGALLQSAGLAVHWSLLAGAVLVAALAAASLPALLPPASALTPIGGTEKEHASDPVRHAEPAVPGRRHGTGRLAALAALAFLLMLAEGTANDWSALQAVEHLGLPGSAASLAYAAFAVAMTIGRFTADPAAHRFGPVNVVRIGSAVAAVGMLTVVLSGLYPLTLLGWIIFGLGLSGIVPQIFTAAGNLGSVNQGVAISRVISAGYIGLLAGPAIIGWLAGGIGLTSALALPVLFCVVGVLLARQVAPGPRPTAPVATAGTRPIGTA